MPSTFGGTVITPRSSSETKQAAKAEELRDLRDQEITAPAKDADRLATWQLDAEQDSPIATGVISTRTGDSL